MRETVAGKQPQRRVDLLTFHYSPGFTAGLTTAGKSAADRLLNRVGVIYMSKVQTLIVCKAFLKICGSFDLLKGLYSWSTKFTYFFSGYSYGLFFNLKKFSATDIALEVEVVSQHLSVYQG